MRMDLKSELLAQADEYCATARISKARLATLVANDGKFFDRIEGGGGLTIKMYERFLTYFRANPASERASADRGAPAEKLGGEAAALSDEESVLLGAAAILDPGAAHPTLSPEPIVSSSSRQARPRRRFLTTHDRSQARGNS